MRRKGRPDRGKGGDGWGGSEGVDGEELREGAIFEGRYIYNRATPCCVYSYEKFSGTPTKKEPEH